MGKNVLHTYIQDTIAQYGESAVRTSLKEAGYGEDEIDRAFLHITSQPLQMLIWKRILFFLIGTAISTVIFIAEIILTGMVLAGFSNVMFINTLSLFLILFILLALGNFIVGRHVIRHKFPRLYMGFMFGAIVAPVLIGAFSVFFVLSFLKDGSL